MPTHTNNITLQESQSLSVQATTYSDIIRVDKYDELNLFLDISAQTGYSGGDSLAVSVQIVDPDGNYIDLAGAAFTTVTDSSASGANQHIAIVAFGSRIRLKYVVLVHTAASYTFTVKGYGKGDF